MRHTFLYALAATALSSASNLAAQECIGLPLANAQSSLAGNISLADQTTTLGGQLSFNVAGPVSLGGGAGIIMADGENGLAANGQIALDMPVSGLTMNSCLVSGLEFKSFSVSSAFAGFEFEATSRSFVVPIGFGIGKSLPANPSTSLILHGIPQFLLVRTQVDVQNPVPGAPDLDDSETDLAFGLHLGGTLVSKSIFGGLGIDLTTLDGSDVVFTISVGTVLGRR